MRQIRIRAKKMKKGGTVTILIFIIIVLGNLKAK